MSSRFSVAGAVGAPTVGSPSGTASAPAHEVSVGSRVRVRDHEGEEEFLIVDHAEADVTRRRISALSPLGSALMGRQAGESVRVRTPVGVRSVTLLAVY
ncbi:MAG TPA: GreA/GreB family elongation factor [Candidatus Dormibacteraeota bacterium]|jgi:transcription elongation GreA/GreB family factor|nr:GreA/GreB family elongation factor [Candidatus Dormibacteraeota bacterium]